MAMVRDLIRDLRDRHGFGTRYSKVVLSTGPLGNTGEHRVSYSVKLGRLGHKVVNTVEFEFRKTKAVRFNTALGRVAYSALGNTRSTFSGSGSGVWFLACGLDQP